MTFQERIASLREKLKDKIKPESKKEELEEINGLIAELDDVEKDHNAVVAENAKFKDTIVKMVLKTGDGKEPEDESGGSKPKTIEECIAEVEKGGK